jgi:hypothetical protein
MVYERKLLFSFCGLETVGQPNLLDVAHEQTLIESRTIANPASNLFFIVSGFFD